MRRRSFTIVLFALVVLAVAAPALSQPYYFHNDPYYWWYHPTGASPAFEVVIPALHNTTTEQSRFWTERNLYGEHELEIFLTTSSEYPVGSSIRISDVISSAVTVAKIKERVRAEHSHVFSNTKILADRELVTEIGTKGWFLAFESSNPSGMMAMVRVVIFQRGREYVYLTLKCYSTDYESTPKIRDLWIMAVNTFKWLD